MLSHAEIRAALDAVMAAPPCEHCGAPVGLLVPRGCEVAIPLTIHDDDCPERAA